MTNMNLLQTELYVQQKSSQKGQSICPDGQKKEQGRIRSKEISCKLLKNKKIKLNIEHPIDHRVFLTVLILIMAVFYLKKKNHEYVNLFSIYI